MTTATYIVNGVTCDHCVGAVRGEVGQLAGVTDVAVDLPTGQVTVTSDSPVEAAAVRAAVEQAGYEVAA